MSELNFYLLQINDALFPIGAYSHSQGLETYIQRGIVHDEATAKEYIHHKIRWNLAFTELLDEIREFLASDPEIDGGATILSCGDLAVRIFGLRAQRLQQMAEKIKSAYEKFL